MICLTPDACLPTGMSSVVLTKEEASEEKEGLLIPFS